MLFSSLILLEGILNTSQRNSSTTPPPFSIAGSLSVSAFSEDVHIGGLAIATLRGVSGRASESAGCLWWRPSRPARSPSQTTPESARMEPNCDNSAAQSSHMNQTLLAPVSELHNTKWKINKWERLPPIWPVNTFRVVSGGSEGREGRRGGGGGRRVRTVHHVHFYVLAIGFCPLKDVGVHWVFPSSILDFCQWPFTCSFVAAPCLRLQKYTTQNKKLYQHKINCRI